jgi:hypothetical protein
MEADVTEASETAEEGGPPHFYPFPPRSSHSSED